MAELHTDILVAGAGPAGISAALAAADAGCQVVVIDDNPRAGGQIWRGGPASHLPDAAQQALEKLLRHPHIRLLTSTRLVMQVSPGVYLLEENQQASLLHAGKIIICSGGRELLLPFPGWTLPGVTGAGGLQALVKGGVPVNSQRIVIAGSGPLLLASADTARKNGAQIVGLLEQQSWPAVAAMMMQLWRWPSKLRQAVSLVNARYRAGSYVTEALGENRLEAVKIRQGGREKIIECDRLACGFGLVPNLQLAELLGAEHDHDGIFVDEQQRTRLPDVYAAGECTGIGGSELSIAEGYIAGYCAAGHPHQATPWVARREQWHSFATLLKQTFSLKPELKTLVNDSTLICRCEDVRWAEVSSLENLKQIKMLTRCGMGPCQGKICHSSLRFLKPLAGSQTRPPIMNARIDTLCLPDEQAPR